MNGWVGAALVGALAVVLGVLLLLRTRRARALEHALARSAEDLENLERAFSRFAPQGVVEKLTSGTRDIDPKRREVTVLFADIVGFTQLSESVDPGVLVPILNDYFRRMAGIIREHHGHVSRIMGDGLMALFGSLDTNRWQAPDAVRAALAMRAALLVLNQELRERSQLELQIGVGIHRGDCVAAVIGSHEMMEFTVLGDPVNVAARVEGLTRTHGVDVLVTDAVREQLDERFALVEMPPSPVKGKAEPMVTWAVEGFDPARAMRKSGT